MSRNNGQSAVTKAYRQILTESTTATVTGLMTHEDAVQAAMYRVVDKGLPTTMIDKAGRNWSIEGYTRMVVNTTVNRAFNEVRLQRMKDFDMHLALMSSHPNSRPACAPIQGHDEAIKNGKLVQQQRARERAIRDAKKRLRVAEQLGDDQW
ncbi:phage minor capsid protein [Limosilactobacillus fermentum]|uniref:phage minor capsid protein n=1 Tax=Limosilactobacillus fermentum TaxID=1613 RepID=UPI00389268CC